jgi:hypothetical protein
VPAVMLSCPLPLWAPPFSHCERKLSHIERVQAALQNFRSQCRGRRGYVLLRTLR